MSRLTDLGALLGVRHVGPDHPAGPADLRTVRACWRLVQHTYH